MKKTAFLTGVLAFLFTAAVNAQTDSTKSAPAKTNTDPTVDATTKVNTDMWNNYSPDKYKMLPMPEPLTTEKIFPVIGHYNLTAKDDNATADVRIRLDESNKGIAWVEGLPQGKIKAYLKTSPSTYKIPMQKTEEGKDVPEGVLIFNKDANTLDVCIGCAYKAEDPASAFAVATEQPVVEEQPTAKAKKATAKTKMKKVAPAKTWKYSGTKISESTAAVSN